ncbi:phosphoketolase family protein [Periweissella beninensis]|uniref:Phosphoketolase family protein n=1 Tax=Periweissella beninensis TaxID=504936 RepID=A0ABT0VIJ0_9LACO|nr:phosphoketolase family protein [Periweissella beninensis]MBM7543927.1 xylulose-5-phosphate/fructose-6-phosphate phosphoketolase [Periweissella beninensis]MCM2437653.1 phosphoketolase family protein [Periweissella beninensis]MCT4396153.1 phosphoketolase family protein [Periweissella beninensis]
MAVDYDSKEYLENVDAWWRATTYISAGVIFLKDNALFSVTNTPLTREDVKAKPIGHWGTVSGQTFLYAHASRLINKYDLNMFYVEGPGHAGQVMFSNSWIDGSYTEDYPEITRDLEGLNRLFKRFSFPGGVGSHATAQTPGSLHEGGELGYSLSHGVGAILDNPDQIGFVVVGDGESETGPLTTAWQSNKFINPATDGAVLPILDLNGFKISNPTILSRYSDEQLVKYFEGFGWSPRFIENDDIHDYMAYHELAAKVFDEAIEDIKQIQKDARENGRYQDGEVPAWPVIVARLPKGWGGPTHDEAGMPVEDSFRSHQVPLKFSSKHFDEDIDAFNEWMNSYRPTELFNEDGTPKQFLIDLAPKGDKRMSMNPIANGGVARGEEPNQLDLPDYRDFANDVTAENRGHELADGNRNMDMFVLSTYLREVTDRNMKDFRFFGPDETMSNRLWDMFETTDRQWMEEVRTPNDQFVGAKGRIIDSQLSEHQAEGWLEAYTLTGRRGFFASYESFLRVVDSMITQIFKWYRQADEIKWRNKYPSLNLIATSTAFQQDHNGYTHQDPGLLTHLAEKKTKYIREFLPADGNTLLAVADKALRLNQTINLIVASKQPRQQWFTIDEATELVEKGLKIVDWASTVADNETPDIVFASAGTEPTIESLAAVWLLNQNFPELKIRYVNVVDLLRLKKQDPRSLSDDEFDAIFTTDKPVVFGFHGYEDLVKDIFFDRHNHNLDVHGYREEGDITTTFDMRVYSQLDRFNQVKDALKMLDGVIDAAKSAEVSAKMDAILAKHFEVTRNEGIDIPEFTEWNWSPLKK